jgi:hypothetical protein
MMDFERIKQEAQKSCSVYVKDFSDAKQKLAMFLKRQDDTRSRQTRLEAQKAKLTQSADSSVGESVNSFEKFKTSLRRVNAEIEATSEALLVLTNKIIPEQQKVGVECEKKLKPKLLEFWKAPQRACEAEMRQKLDEIIRLRDDFETAFISTADGCGVCGADLLALTEIYGSVLPNPSHTRFSTIYTQPKRTQDAKTPAAVEPQQAVPAVTETPQVVQGDGPTPEPLVEPEPEPAQGTTVLTGVCDAP